MKVPWTGKSTTPPADCSILRCLKPSRILSWFNSSLWLGGIPLSRVRVAGKEEKTSETGKSKAAMTIPAGKATAISGQLWLVIPFDLNGTRIETIEMIKTRNGIVKGSVALWNLKRRNQRDWEILRKAEKRNKQQIVWNNKVTHLGGLRERC